MEHAEEQPSRHGPRAEPRANTPAHADASVEAMLASRRPRVLASPRAVRRLAAFLTLFAVFPACRCSGSSLPGSAPPAASSTETEAAGVRFVERLTGGASSSERLPLIIGIHGYGGSPEHFGRVFTTLTVRARVILPHDILDTGGGHAWFVEPDPAHPEPPGAGIRLAADRIAAMIAELVRRRPTAGRPIVTGFSQGGMLSYALAALHPESVGAAFPVGGLLPQPIWPTAWPVGQVRPPIHAFHGDRDPRVPIEDDRATAGRLRELGLGVELTEYPGEVHTIPAEMRHDLVRTIEEAAQGSRRDDGGGSERSGEVP
jgi:phospholipase/carboxylesterase